MNVVITPIACRVAALLLTAAGLLSACATTTYDSFRPVRDAQVEVAYVNTTADFSKYDRLIAEEMGIYYPTHAPASEQDMARVRTAFRDAFMTELAEYDIVKKPADGVLRISASLVDLRKTAADRLPQLSSDINEILQAGKLTFVIEFSDSKSGRVLARAADTERSPRIDLPEDGSADGTEVRAAAQHWAKLLRDFLDSNMRGKTQP
jgi:hypothetical protein